MDYQAWSLPQVITIIHQDHLGRGIRREGMRECEQRVIKSGKAKRKQSSKAKQKVKQEARGVRRRWGGK